MNMAARFELHRDEDATGVSGTGVVAEGVAFRDGTVALRWTSEWPTSVIFHERGIESVEHVHGHGGLTRLVWLDPRPYGADGDLLHDYWSTACFHDLHDRCRETCKWCGDPCACPCHVAGAADL